MFDWWPFHAEALWWLGIASVAMFIGTLLIIPWLVIRIRADYFVHRPAGRESRIARHAVLRALALILKNALGLVLILAGVAMLVLPGQGILTILMGMMLLNFPGKRRLELWLIRRPGVLKAVNWMRKKAKQPALEVEQDEGN